MKKNYLFIGAAAIMMAGCASDDLVGDENISSGETPIAFSMNTPNVTRDGSTTAGTAEDAKKLNYEFIVWGEKNEEDGTAMDAKNIVFENYRVDYDETKKAATANTTVSNTNGWEYVGITPYAASTTANQAFVSPSINGTATTGKTQTIKYWDFNKNYTFTAVSAEKTDISYGYVKITKNYNSITDAKKKGYTITMTKNADPTKVYVADRKDNVKMTAAPVSAVQMQFRNFQTKIRFGFYETVPGYNVQITGVKYGTNTSAAVKTALGIDGDFVTKPTDQDEVLKYEVTYDANNKPVVTVTKSSTSAAKFAEFGKDAFDTNLGKTADNAVYDKTENQKNGAYSYILPNTGNETPMTFKVSYKLISEDTGEEIAITDRQVTVPAVYCQWKPNFAYTYLFKVSDASAELYPITFDAVVEADEVSCQETITEVAGDTKNVSITTYATVSSTDKTSVESTTENEYSNGNVIYASVMDNGTAVQSFTSTTMKLYTITAKNASNNNVTSVITEAAVANCIKNGGTNDAKTVTDLNNVTMTATPVAVASQDAAGISYETAVPAEDGGTDRTIGAMKWTAATAGTYYAIEYIKAANGSGPETKYYKIVKIKD